MSRVERVARSQCPAEGPAVDRGLHAVTGGMHPRTSTGKCGGFIRHHLAIASDHPKEIGAIGTFPAAQARSDGFQCSP